MELDSSRSDEEGGPCARDRLVWLRARSEELLVQTAAGGHPRDVLVEYEDILWDLVGMGKWYFGKADAEALVQEARLHPALVDEWVLLLEGERKPTAEAAQAALAGLQSIPDLGSARSARGSGPFFSSTKTLTEVLGGYGSVEVDIDPGSVSGTLTGLVVSCTVQPVQPVPRQCLCPVVWGEGVGALRAR